MVLLASAAFPPVGFLLKPGLKLPLLIPPGNHSTFLLMNLCSSLSNRNQIPQENMLEGCLFFTRWIHKDRGVECGERFLSVPVIYLNVISFCFDDKISYLRTSLLRLKLGLKCHNLCLTSFKVRTLSSCVVCWSGMSSSLVSFCCLCISSMVAESL